MFIRRIPGELSEVEAGRGPVAPCAPHRGTLAGQLELKRHGLCGLMAMCAVGKVPGAQTGAEMGVDQ